MAAVNPANPQSWNRYVYVMNNPLSNIDPLGLDCVSAWTGDQTYAQVADCFDQGCMTDASCDSSPLNPSQDPAGDANSFFNSTIAESHAEDFSRYQTMVDCGFNPGSCGPFRGKADITVYAYLRRNWFGTTTLAVLPPPEAVNGSQPYYVIGDVPIGMDFINCAQCRSIWRNAPSFIGITYGGSVLAGGLSVAVPYAAPYAGSLALQVGGSPQTVEFIGDFVQGVAPGVPPTSWGALAGEAVGN
jgi:hypothetical protein